MIMLTTPLQIEGARLCALKGASRLECLGMRHSRGSVYALVKRQFGFKGNKQNVLRQLETYIREFNDKNFPQQ